MEVLVLILNLVNVRNHISVSYEACIIYAYYESILLDERKTIIGCLIALMTETTQYKSLYPQLMDNMVQGLTPTAV